MVCMVHHGKIRGKVYWWHHKPMCGRCYRYFCKSVRVIRAQKPSAPRPGILSRLERWLRG